jgi:hypothetical protein
VVDLLELKTKSDVKSSRPETRGIRKLLTTLFVKGQKSRGSTVLWGTYRLKTRPKRGWLVVRRYGGRLRGGEEGVERAC